MDPVFTVACCVRTTLLVWEFLYDLDMLVLYIAALRAYPLSVALDVIAGLHA